MARHAIGRFKRLRMPSRAALVAGVVLSLCVGCGSERDELDLVGGEWRPDRRQPTSVIYLGLQDDDRSTISKDGSVSIGYGPLCRGSVSIVPEKSPAGTADVDYGPVFKFTLEYCFDSRYMPRELYGDVLRNGDGTPTLVLIAPEVVGACRLVKVVN